MRRWPGQQVPVVRFVTGGEVFMLPEVFQADVHTAGTCKRIQVCPKGSQGKAVHGLVTEVIQL